MSTKTEAVRGRVFQAILRGDHRPGDRIPPEREMATLTGTSRVTVRRAYAALERSGILQRRHGSGAYISTAPRGNAQRTPPRFDGVAVLASLRDPFALEFLEALERSLTEQGAFLVLKLTDQDPRRETRAAMDLVSRGTRNLVVWASGGRYEVDLFARLRILGANMVFFDRMLPGEFADYVGLDNRHAVRTILKRALDDGKRRLLMVSHEGLGADSDRQREEEFERFTSRHKLPGRIVRVPVSGPVPPRYDRQASTSRGLPRRSARRKAKPVLTSAADWFAPAGDLAVVGVNDDIALRIKRMNPRLSVYGIDGLPEAGREGIVSYRQPMRAMARAAVRLLFEQREKGDAWRARTLYFKGKLVDPRS